MNVRRGSAADTTTLADSSVPSLSATPVARPLLVITRSTSALSLISAPNDWAARASTCVKPPLPPLWNAHDPRLPSCSPMLWNSSTRPDPCDIGPTLVPMMPDDDSQPLRIGGLEVVVEEVGGAAGEQPHEVVQHARLDAAHVPRQIGELGQPFRRGVEQVGRRLVEQRLDGADHHRDVVAVLVVGVGVALGVAGDLLDVLVAVLPHHEAVAVLHRAERGRHQQRHEAVLDEVELVHDVGPQQAERVRERRELEARAQLLGDRRPAHQVTPLEDQRAQPRLGEVGAVDQPVVPAADRRSRRTRGWSLMTSAPFNAIVLRCGANIGLRATWAPTCT